MELWIWILIPALGAVIGYGTNLLAVRMIFRPLKPKSILGWRLQGLVPRRQADLANSIGKVVGKHLFDGDDLARAMEGVDLEKPLAACMDEVLDEKLMEFKRMPLIGSFLTDDRIDDLKSKIVASAVKRRGKLIEPLRESFSKSVDVEGIVRAKVAEFPVDRLEQIILEVASRELHSIERLGAVLGFALGLVQAGIVTLIA